MVPNTSRICMRLGSVGLTEQTSQTNKRSALAWTQVELSVQEQRTGLRFVQRSSGLFDRLAKTKCLSVLLSQEKLIIQTTLWLLKYTGTQEETAPWRRREMLTHSAWKASSALFFKISKMARMVEWPQFLVTVPVTCSPVLHTVPVLLFSTQSLFSCSPHSPCSPVLQGLASFLVFWPRLDLSLLYF